MAKEGVFGKMSDVWQTEVREILTYLVYRKDKRESQRAINNPNEIRL